MPTSFLVSKDEQQVVFHTVSFNQIFDLGTGQLLGEADGEPVAFAANDSQLVTYWNEQLIRWDIARGVELNAFPMDYNRISFSWRNNQVISLSRNETGTQMRHLEVSDLSVSNNIELSSRNVEDIVLNPNGTQIVTLGEPASFNVYASDLLSEQDQVSVRLSYESNVDDRAEFDPKSPLPPGKSQSKILDAAFDPTGTSVAVATRENRVALIDLKTKKLSATLDGWQADQGRKIVSNRDYVASGLRGFARCIAWSPDGRTIAVGYEARDIGLWDVATGKLKARLSGHKGWVLALKFTPDGQTLVSAAGDKSVRFWDLQTNRQKSALTAHSSFVRDLQISPDGKLLASASGDGRVNIWQIATLRPIKYLSVRGKIATSVAWSPDGSAIVAASDTGMLEAFRVSDGTSVWTAQPVKALITRVQVAPDGSKLWISSRDNTVRELIGTGGQAVFSKGQR
jgi:WD40 repeat protein